MGVYKFLLRVQLLKLNQTSLKMFFVGAVGICYPWVTCATRSLIFLVQVSHNICTSIQDGAWLHV